MHNVKSDIVYGYDPTTGYLHTAATTFKVGATFTHTITYAYNDGTGGSTNDGTRQSMSIDSGAWAFMYQSDGYSRMTSVTNPSGNTTTWDYDSNDTIATQTLNPTTDNVMTTYLRTPLEARLMSVGNTPTTVGTTSLFQSNTIAYTADGQMVGWGGGRFTYDMDHRVQNDTASGGSWQYDGMGNITNDPGYELPGYTDPTNPTRFTRYYNADNQWMGYTDSERPGMLCNAVSDIPGNPVLFNYDPAGNPLQYKGDTLTFDFANRLTQYTKYDPTTPKTVMQAEYGANGLRAWKKSYGADGTATPTETYYLYDGDQPIMEFAGDGETCTAINTWGPNGLVSRADLRDGRTTLKDVYYLYDPLGNVVQRLDGMGATLRVRSSDTYDAYGNRNTTGTMETVDANDPWGYKAQYGYYTDYETKLILCEHRYYDPFAGHWLTRDPIGYSGGPNLYEYCGGEPIGGIDPNGLTVFEVPGRGWWSDETDWCKETDAGGNLIHYGMYDHVYPNGKPIGDWYVWFDPKTVGNDATMDYHCISEWDIEPHGGGDYIAAITDQDFLEICMQASRDQERAASHQQFVENTRKIKQQTKEANDAYNASVIEYQNRPKARTENTAISSTSPQSSTVEVNVLKSVPVRIVNAMGSPGSPTYGVNVATSIIFAYEGEPTRAGSTLAGGQEAFWQRPPDYISGNLTAAYGMGVTGGLELSSDGKWYAQGGIAGGGPGASLCGGWILKLDTTKQDRTDHLTGMSYTGQIGIPVEGIPLAGGLTYSPSAKTWSYMTGFGTEGVSGSTTWSKPLN